MKKNDVKGGGKMAFYHEQLNIYKKSLHVKQVRKTFWEKAILYFIISTFNTVLIYVVKHKCHFSSNLSSDLEFKVIRFIMMLEMELGPQIAQAYICIFSVCVYENLI